MAFFGTVRGPYAGVTGELLELQLDTGAHHRFVNVAHTTVSSRGRHRFPSLRVFTDTRARVEQVHGRSRHSSVLEVLVRAPPYPSSRDVIAAAHYLSGRTGTKAFAVLDDDERLAGVEPHRRFHSASVVKSMLLVAYLRMLAADGRGLDGASRSLLYPMIHSSDNGAASAVPAAVGEAALNRVAHDAGMSDYVPAGASWGFTEVSAADLARFFFHQDAMIPVRFDGYARWLLSHIEAGESRGIPAAARPGFEVFFKGGRLPEVEGLVNQAGRLERPGVRFAVEVLTTHDPSMEYGEQTIEGVTARLVGRAR